MTSTISRKLRVLALIMALVMVMPCVAGFGVAADEDDGLLTEEEVKAIAVRTAPATAAYKQLVDSWRNDAGEVVYPDSFGGCYLSDECKLVVKLVNNNASLREYVSNIVANVEILEFEDTDISRNELYNLHAVVTESPMFDDCLGVGISFITSTVNVYVDNDVDISMTAATYITMGERYTIDQHMQIIYEENKQQLHANLMPGQAFDATLNNTVVEERVGTLGWYGKYRFPNEVQRRCILISGHVVKAAISLGYGLKFDNSYFSYNDLQDENKCYNSLDNPYGYTGLEVPQYDGDFAILFVTGLVETDDVPYPSSGTIEVTHWVSSESEYDDLNGNFVFKPEGISGYRSGRITEVNLTKPYEISEQSGGSYWCRNQIKIAAGSGSGIFSREGDSGGSVFTFIDNVPYLVGIITSGNDDGESLVTTLGPILDEGFEPYPY